MASAPSSARSITINRTRSRAMPRRSGGSFAANSTGRLKVIGVVIDVNELTNCCPLPPVLFLSAKSLAIDISRLLGSKIEKYFRHFRRLRPFAGIFIRFGGAMHGGIHIAGIDPVDAHVAFRQLRRPGLRHPFQTKF